MSTAVQDRLVSQIRNRLENPSQTQNGSEPKPLPNRPMKKTKLHRTKSPNPPKPVPYREHVTKKKEGGPEGSWEESSGVSSSQGSGTNPVGYATVLVHPTTPVTHSQPQVPITKPKSKDGRPPKEYEIPLPNTNAKKRDFEKGMVGGDKRPFPPRTSPPIRSQNETEKQQNKGAPLETKPVRPPAPVKTGHVSSSSIKHQDGENRGRRESPSASSSNQSDDSSRGIKSLISRFDDSQERRVSVGSKPVQTSKKGRKISAPDIYQVDNLTHPSATPIQEVEDGDKYYIHMRNDNRAGLGGKGYKMATSIDSGFSDAIEGSSSSDTTPPNVDQSNLDKGNRTPSLQRHVNESQEEKLRRSVERRGLISDGFLVQHESAKGKDVTGRSCSLEGPDEVGKTKTLDSVTSDGYLKVLPGQHIPPPKEPVIGTNEFDSLMKAVGIKEGKEVKIGNEKRKQKNHFRKLSDPAIKALKVALDAEASRRAIDDIDAANKQKKGGVKTDDTPTSPPKEKTKLFSKLTRAVRGNKKEDSHSNGVAKDMKKSQSFSSAKTNRITSADISESLPFIQEELEAKPSSNNPHMRVWEDRLDLHLRPPAPLPRLDGEIYAYAKMPFRRNQRVSVKIAGLRPLRHTASVPIDATPLPRNTPIHSKASSEIIEPPPPIYPKSRSIKRSILINQGLDVNRIRDWNKSVCDLLAEKKAQKSGSPDVKGNSLGNSHQVPLTPSEETCPLSADDDPPLLMLEGLKRSSSFSESMTRDMVRENHDPYYLLVKKPSILQHMLSTSVEVLFKPSEEEEGKDSASKTEPDTRNRAQTMPISLPLRPKYENFDDLSNYVILEESTMRAGRKMTAEHRPDANPMDDYIKMNRGQVQQEQVTTPTLNSKAHRYMNIMEASSVLNEEDLEIPDYIKMSGVQSNPHLPPFDHQMSGEGYIKCRSDVTMRGDEYMTFRREQVEVEEDLTRSAPIPKSSYMNWVDLPEEYNGTIGRKTDSNSETTLDAKLQLNQKSESSPTSLLPPKNSLYAYLPPEEGEDIIEETDLGEEELAQRRDSFIVKSEEQQAQDGTRYMNFEMAEQSFSTYPMITKKVPLSEKLPMPSPRKASLSRRRPLNSLHPDIHFDELPQELKQSLNLQGQRKSVLSTISDSGESPMSSATMAMKSLGGYCIVCSACEEFTHMGGVLKPKDWCGIYVEVPNDAIKKNRTQKLWFVACYDSQYPGGSWKRAGTLSRNSSNEVQLLEEEASERESRTTTISPLIFIGPSDAEVLKPLKVHLPHCISFQESSLRCWLEAKCYEMPHWATVCQRSFFHTPPKDKQFAGTRQSYKPQIVFQLLPTSATIRTSHLGWFCLRGSGFRGAKKAAKRMFASIFQRVPNEYNLNLSTINEDEEEMETKLKKDASPKTELLVVISNDLPYGAEVIQWILEKGTNKYTCLERYMPFKYCANGRDCEVILYGDSCRTPIQTTSIPFGNLWRMKRIGEGWQTLTVRTPEKYKDQILTFSLKQGDFPKQYSRNIKMNDY